MATGAARSVALKVRPILSIDQEESRKRVLNLYKAWYRQLPYIVRQYAIPKSVEDCRERLRQEFFKHEHLTDIRVIDMLIIKGQMTLKEVVECWQQKGHIMTYFKPTAEPKPTDFLSKFIQGVN